MLDVGPQPINSMLKFKPLYLFLAVILFAIELLIALFVHDEIIRPHIGDFLVVILIYCFLKAFINTSVRRMAIFVLLFSYAVEILQYFKIVEIVGLQDSKLARIIIGTSFSWLDILSYTLGILCVILLEKLCSNKLSLNQKEATIL
jgi:hypothetical protein